MKKTFTLTFMKNLIKILRKKLEYYYKSFSEVDIDFEQNKNFQRFNFNRKLSIEKLNKISFLLFKEKYNENNSMFSEHLIVFSALSEKFANNKEFNNILEIGTYDGKTAIILSELFPNATITTIDLPDNDENFTNTYDRKEDQEFIKKRNSILSTKKNVKFEQLNSLNLYNYPSGIYDLIWIDGNHDFPTVAFDIINSFRLLKKNGFMMVDDVYKKNNGINNIYKSTAAYESLQTMLDSKLIKKFDLFFKRLNLKNNLSNNQKFVALVKKED